MNHTYIIGEIGQNHNGSVEIAKKLIDAITEPVIDKLFGERLEPVDAVKFVKRDLNEELSRSEMNRPYLSPHSFGKTYGEHRAFLELDDDQHYELYQYAKSKALDFIETLCARGCFSLFRKFQPDRLKVASRDLTNLPLLEAMAETKIPIILSTGMGAEKELDQALGVITKYHSDISILHCLSQYPSEYKNINLNTIPFLIENYPEHTIGYSDHSIGIVIPAVAVALGARIIEKHITLDRNMKGTDHKGSLGVDGIYRMVRDIRNVERALGKKEIFVDDSVRRTREKLERSIASSRYIATGEVIDESCIHMLSPGTGLRWSEREKILGKRAAVNIEKDELILENMTE